MGSLQKRQNSKVLACIYILCFFIAALGECTFLPSQLKVFTMVAPAAALGILLVYADFNNIKTITGFVVIYSIWLLVIIVYSIIIWIVEFQSVPYILRGCSKVAFQFVFIAVIAGSTYLFGEKAIHYTFYGLLLGNIAITLIYIPQYSAAEIIQSVNTFVASFGEDATDYMKLLEIHDITFTYGFFMIYFIFFDKITSKKRRFINTIFAALFFIIGYKRIAAMGFLVVAITAVLLMRLNRGTQLKVMKIVMFCVIIAAFLYLFVVRYDIYSYIMELWGVNVNRRNELYDEIFNYYRISPWFFGYGFEFVHIMMLQIVEAGGTQFNGMVDIHNDILRVYIEMGFWGFFAWLWYTLIFQFNWIKSKFSVDTVRLFFLCEIYIFFTYLTDNTLFYFYTGMVLRLIPLAYALRDSSVNASEPGSSKLILIDDKVKNRFEILSRNGESSTTLFRQKIKASHEREWRF